MSKLYVREPDDVSRGRWAALVGGALVIALLAGLGWLAAGAADPPGPVSSPRQQARLPTKAAPVPKTKAMPMAAAPPASSASSVPAGQLEVCGIGPVSEAEWNSLARREAADAAVRAARRRTMASLKASADPLSRALALALESRGEVPAAGDPARCSGPDCPAAPASKTASGTAAQPRPASNMAPRDALARMALTSRSPELYGLAWRVCVTDGGSDTTSACRMLSAEQWARLDPGNAVPWASVYQQAALRRDRAAMADAQFRMSLADVVDTRAGRLPGLAMAHVPPGISLLDTEGVVREVAGLDVLGVADATRDCTSAMAAAGDVNRHQLCDSMANALWQHGRQPDHLSAAIHIGEALGWPSERLQPMRDEVAALSFVAEAALSQPSLSCDGIRRRIGHFNESGRLGQVAWARRAIEASGKPVTHWAAAARANQPAPVRPDLPASDAPVASAASAP